MATLLLRFAGPVQSWAGYRVSPVAVGTLPVPSKTGVAGLLGACLGEKNHRSLMNGFQLDVRADRVNPATVDYQVASAFQDHELPVAQRAERLRSASNVKLKKQITGSDLPGAYERDFLPHAEFLVAITGTDDQVEAWHEAVRGPVFMLYLGRRPNAPSFPFRLGVSRAPAAELLGSVPRVRRHDERDEEEQRVRCYRVDGDINVLPDPTHVSPPAVPNRQEYLEWVSQHLSR